MEISQQDIFLLCQTFRKVSAYDFSDYSYKSLYRRVEKILTDNNITIETLIENINKDYNYLENIVNQITVNTTELFRDPEVWIAVSNLIQQRFANAKHISIWHPGCSSGQEVYSMLMLLNEINMFDRASVFGTDINEDVLDTAQHGRYKYVDIKEYQPNFNAVINCNRNEEDFVPISKYILSFPQRGYLQIVPWLVDKPVFAKHNLVGCESFLDRKFDIIMCRNVLIYFNHELQNKIIDFFYNKLNDNGLLIIGRQESIYGMHSDGFEKLGPLYSKKNRKSNFF
ncbi:MAG: hypothetical protein IKQ70_00910 [Bacteroidales bacterium]|nr:hypothetical protein [Bacteroidales bacterium]